MATLDSSIVNVALPSLKKYMNTDLRSIKWIVVLYLLTITCSLLPLGRLSDLYGRKKFFQYGFLVFSLGSLMCGLSQSVTHLVISRILKGFGAAMLMANGPAIITQRFPLKERGRAIGILSMVASIGLVSGPTLGGALITFFGWRSIFLVNVPLGLMGFYLARLHLPIAIREKVSKPFDVLGAMTQALILLVVIFIVDPPSMMVAGTMIDVSRTWLIIAFLCLMVLFVYIEKRVSDPVLDFSLFKIRNFVVGNISNFCMFFAYSSLLVLMPFYLEESLHLDPEHSGYLMSLIPFSIFIVAPLSGYFADRYGTQGPMLLGALLSTAVFTVMSGLYTKGLLQESKSSDIGWCLLLVGAALGIFQSPTNVTVMSSVPTIKSGVASAFLAAVRNLGFVAGTGVSAQIFVWRLRVSGSSIEAFHAPLVLAGVFSALAVVAAVFTEPFSDS